MKPMLRAVSRVCFHAGAVISLLIALVAVAAGIDSNWNAGCVNVVIRSSSERGAHVSVGYAAGALTVSSSSSIYYRESKKPVRWQAGREAFPVSWSEIARCYYFGGKSRLIDWRFVLRFNYGEDFYDFYETLPLWFIAIIAAIWPVFWFRWHRRMRRERMAGCCNSCGYDLRGTVASGRTECPECGNAIREEVPAK